MKFVPGGPINKSAIVQAILWYLGGGKPLHEPMMTLSPDTYRQVSNISRTLVGNEIVDHSDVVGASPVGAAPTTSSFST